ncbi:pentatricopeptide repeat-containing protein At2g46050, mitochondrial [Dendrobium catenatum]|uniref:pentatricopeptide repeat-containing protein At2g46050, mitochondrial n=1 Tax=Dendrobium catenatum TaxID=906689 RepID=UPI0009F54784|nr:pentatricopeptide repeat-containing protein At2g46050, mitochondrial [Dendrobium catenatum]
MYSKCGFVREAQSVFDVIKRKDCVLWNVMVCCHAFNGYEKDAYKVFECMRLQGLAGDGFTFSVLFNSCGTLGCLVLGKQTHGLAVRMGLLDVDVVVCTSLLDMYAKCGAIDDARKLFDSMLVRNVVSWNAMIVGYGHCSQGEDAIKVLVDMLRGCCKPDELTLSSVLSSCASLAAAIESEQVHGFAVKNGLQTFISVGNALIISYAKSGSINDAYKCFCSVSERNLVTWTSMICSFAFHGFAARAIGLFEGMLRGGGRPDSIAFVGVVSACSHAGLVETGLEYFESMVKEYQIKLCEEHYTCLVDLLGRAGHVYEAYNVISQMPCKPNADVLGAFLSGCKVHGKAELAKWAADKLFSMEPNEPVNYKSMSNIYASSQLWEGVSKMRRTMEDNCSKRVPGCCWVEINGRVHTFFSSDKSHPEALRIYSTLEMLIKLMADEYF